MASHFLFILQEMELLTFSSECICPLGKIPIFPQFDQIK